MTNLKITNGRVIDPANNLDKVCDVFIARGKIAALGKPPKDFDTTKATVIDAKGLIVLPGIIDLCTRLRTPSDAADISFGIASESQAAAAGGITRMVCRPDTQPVTDTPAMVRMICDHADRCGFARVHPLAALTVNLDGERLADMALLTDAGCVGVSNGMSPVENTLVMRRAMQYASTYKIPVFITPRDLWLHGNGVVHEGEVSTQLGLPAIPEAAETAGVARDLALIETSGAHAHFDLLSSARSVEMLAEANARGLPVTAGVAIHHLHLTDQNIGAFDTRYKVFPPLRTERDRRALIAGISNGDIRVICSDHQPRLAEEKLAPFVEAAAGISGVDTLLAKTMQLITDGTLPQTPALLALTKNPADIIGINAGHLTPDTPADLCLFDPKLEWQLTPEQMHSNGKNSPWVDETVVGKVVATVIGGKVVYNKKNRKTE